MPEYPTVWDSKNPQQSIQYAITWHVKQTGHLPTLVTIPGAIETRDAAESTRVRTLFTDMEAIGVSIRMNRKALGIVCQGQGNPVRLHQLPWKPLYND